MKIFLIAGKAHSGKETIANMISDYYKDKRVVKTEYSKYIKLFAKEILNWNGDYDTKPRKFLQDIGLIIRKDLNMPNYFVNRMGEDIKVYELYADILVISDIRYKNEIEYMKEHYNDVTTIYIKNEFSDSTLSIEEQNHISETELDNYDKFDYVITNENMEDTRNKINEILERGN